MRIAMIIEAWEPIWGGGQAHVWEISKKLVENHDCEVDIFVMNLKDETKKLPKEENYYNSKLNIIRIGKEKSFCFKDRIFWIFEIIKGIKKHNSRNSYDLIHAHANLPGIPGKILSKIIKKRLVYTVHGTNYLDLKKKSFFYYLEKILYTKIKYDLQISVSKKLLAKKNINNPIIISNGVDLEKFNQQKPPKKEGNFFKILFVGRLDKIKGIDILLRAVKKSEKKLRDKKVKIHLIGYGYDSEKLKKLSKQFKIDDIILFRGKITGGHIIKEYLSSDLFILPSLSEGQPLTILEAWAAKIPVLATDVGDNAFFVKNKINGYLIEPNNTKKLSKTILQAIENENLKKMGLNGYELIKNNYTWEKIANKTYEIYSKIC
jgi:glycosyltransferase involved in cell wall biosynthesis